VPRRVGIALDERQYLLGGDCRLIAALEEVTMSDGMSAAAAG
jgi:hypothetical protein